MMGDGYKDMPSIHWISHEDVVSRQETIVVREARPSHPDPTADEAIGRIMWEEKMAKKKRNRKQFRRPRIGVWRWDDEQRDGRNKDG